MLIEEVDHVRAETAKRPFRRSRTFSGRLSRPFILLPSIRQPNLVAMMASFRRAPSERPRSSSW